MEPTDTDPDIAIQGGHHCRLILVCLMGVRSERNDFVIACAPQPPPRPPHLPLPTLLSSLSSLSLPPSSPAMAGCCVLGKRGRTPWALSLPLGSSLLSSLSPRPPQQWSIQWRCAREEEGMVAIVLASTQRHCRVVEGHAKQARGCFHGPHH